jgi:hypothetical protein
MEIPTNLKSLYQHWIFHSGELAPNKSISVVENTLLFQKIIWFIRERIRIWKKKIVGEQPPYTTDDILSRYRFCNIFREFDRQTIEFHTLLNPLRDNFSVWLLNMFYCRLVARPETIREVGLLSYDEIENRKLYERLIHTKRPRFGTPYVFPISVIQKSETPTRELFIARHLPLILPEVGREIVSWDKKSVYDGLALIIPLFGFNLHFLWTEVLIDTAYQFPQYIDLFGRFPIGPGSLPTLRRINASRDPTILVQDLSNFYFDTDLTYDGKILRLSAENWEGIGCEFRKYTNLKMGMGRKRIYFPNQSFTG